VGVNRLVALRARAWIETMARIEIAQSGLLLSANANGCG